MAESNDFGPASLLHFGMSKIPKAGCEVNGGLTAYRGVLTSTREAEEVAVTVWVRPPAGSPVQIDTQALGRELKVRP
jgi:copper homeostasis protein CutC